MNFIMTLIIVVAVAAKLVTLFLDLATSNADTTTGSSICGASMCAGSKKPLLFRDLG